jgi:hypothetical protein
MSEEQPKQEPKVETVSKAEFDKVLAESESIKGELAKLKADQEAAKLAEQEKKGNLKEVVEQLRKQNAELEATMKTREAKIQAQMLHSQLRDALLSEGCHKEYVDDAIKLLPASALKGIQIGEGYKANQDDVKRAVTEMKNTRQLFFNREVKINDDLGKSGKESFSTSGKKSDDLRKMIIASKQGR